MGEPSPGVAETDAAALTSIYVRSIVLHTENELVAFDAAGQRDPSRSFDLAHAVLDGVLDDGLENEVGHEPFHRPFLDIGTDLEPPLKTNFHDLQISAQKIQLLSQRNLLLGGPLDGVT